MNKENNKTFDSIQQRIIETKLVVEETKMQAAQAQAEAEQAMIKAEQKIELEQRIAQMEAMQNFALMGKKQRSRPFWKKLLGIK